MQFMLHMIVIGVIEEVYKTHIDLYIFSNILVLVTTNAVLILGRYIAKKIHLEWCW